MNKKTIRGGVAPAMLVLWAALACADSAGEARTTRPASGGGESGTAARAATGRPGPGGGGAGMAGGRGGGMVALAASDVATLARGTIEAATPVTGDLQPVERVTVRSRLEGDIVRVLVREGERVAPGQLLARFEDSEQVSARRSAEADLAAAQTDLSTAEWNADQSRELFRQGAVAEIELRTAEQRLAAAKARVAAAEARLSALSLATADTRVVAPMAAVVERRQVSTGERVTRGATLFTLVRNDVLELTAAVPARRAASVAAGQTVRFSADGRTFEGRIARVSPTIDPATRSITVYVQIPNARGELKGGTFASGRIVEQVLNDALLVPTAAIRETPGGGPLFIYKIDGDRIARSRVVLGVVDEPRGVAEVKEGLEAGDRVIVGNVGLLGEGMRVQIVGGESERRSRRPGGPAAPGAPARRP